MTPVHDGRRLVVNTLLVVAELAAAVSALVICFFAMLTFFGEPVVRSQYLQAAVGFGLSAVLLGLGLVAMRSFEPALGVTVLGVVLLVACCTGVLVALLEAGMAPTGDGGEVWWWPFEFFVWLPTTWPMLLVLAAAGLRVPSSPARRRAPAPPAAPGRPQSR
jgi:hypothetical protein